METFATENPWLLASLFGLLGIIIGLLIMSLWQRSQDGGQSVEQLRAEMEDYREKVSDHFATTSELFRDMTEKYQDVYNHLANASQELCEAPMTQDRLEFVEQESLSDDKVEATIEEQESTEQRPPEEGHTEPVSDTQGVLDKDPTKMEAGTKTPGKKELGPEIIDDNATGRS